MHRELEIQHREANVSKNAVQKELTSSREDLHAMKSAAADINTRASTAQAELEHIQHRILQPRARGDGLVAPVLHSGVHLSRMRGRGRGRG